MLGLSSAVSLTDKKCSNTVNKKIQVNQQLISFSRAQVAEWMLWLENHQQQTKTHTLKKTNKTVK